MSMKPGPGRVDTRDARAWVGAVGKVAAFLLDRSATPPHPAPAWNFIVAGLACERLVPDARVNEVARLGWPLIGSLTVPLAAGPDVSSIHFMPAVQSHSGGPDAGTLFVPANWVALAKADPCMQIGAAAYMLSQVRDFWNRKVGVDYQPVLARARALEARVLRVLDGAGVLTPNEYQRHALARNPVGADDALWYAGEPFDLARARAQFRNIGDVPIRPPTPCPNATDPAFDTYWPTA